MATESNIATVREFLKKAGNGENDYSQILNLRPGDVLECFAQIASEMPTTKEKAWLSALEQCYLNHVRGRTAELINNPLRKFRLPK